MGVILQNQMSAASARLVDELTRIPAQEISDPTRLPRKPLVTVRMTTYNHEPYIAEAIEGVANQKCDFPVELLIGEDCSLDRTREICLAYQSKYPGLVRLVVSPENVGMRKNSGRLLARARGRYLATCEGDDYWLSSNGLKERVDALESHPEICMCCSWIRTLRQDKAGTWRFTTTEGPRTANGYLTLEDVLQIGGNPVPSCTKVARLAMIEYVEWNPPIRYGDFGSLLLLLERGPCAVIPEALAARRVHPGGIHSMAPAEERAFHRIQVWKAWNEHSGRRYEPRVRQIIGSEYLGMARALALKKQRLRAGEALRQARACLGVSCILRDLRTWRAIMELAVPGRVHQHAARFCRHGIGRVLRPGSVSRPTEASGIAEVEPSE